MEYKGGFLLRSARYSGNSDTFEKELETKMVKGCKQMSKKIEQMFHLRSDKRRKIRGLDLDKITRVVPLLVVQDQLLSAPFVNWFLNKRFSDLLNRDLLRIDVKVDSLIVVGIRELETMAESSRAGKFDLFAGLQLKCYVDPSMTLNLHNFLLEKTNYGEGRSKCIESIVEELFAETSKYLFGKKIRRRQKAHPRRDQS
jgi:hypothetical protein